MRWGVYQVFFFFFPMLPIIFDVLVISRPRSMRWDVYLCRFLASPHQIKSPTWSSTSGINPELESPYIQINKISMCFEIRMEFLQRQAIREP